MKVFRLILVVQFLAIISYTIITGINHGWNLLAIFFNNILSFNWSGQFNLDFLFLLFLSGLWISWRSRFTAKGIFLGLVALLFGIMFVAPYLFYLSFKTKGDIKEIIFYRLIIKNE